MLIKFGSIVVGGRGKLGGQVYSHNRGGDYVRNNATPVNPQTPTQMAARAALALFSQMWSTLTQAQISGWNSAAENFPRTNVFGDSKKLSGKNLFTGLNRELELTNQATITDAPAPAPINVPTAVTSIVVNSAGAVTFEVEGTAVGDQIVLLATPPVSAGTNFVKNRLRVVAIMAATATPTAADIGADYVAKFGAPAIGTKVFVGAYAVNAVGQRSPQVTGSTITVDGGV